MVHRLAVLAAVLILASGCDQRPLQAQYIVFDVSEGIVLDQWGDTATVTAIGELGGEGGSVPLEELTWSTSDPAVVRIDAEGQKAVLISVRAGSAVITASAMTSLGRQSRELPVEVVAQRNSRCTAPAPDGRSAPGAMPAFQREPGFLTGIPASGWCCTAHQVLDFDGDGDEDVLRLEYSSPQSDPYGGALTVLENVGGALRDASGTLLAAAVVPDHPRDYEIADFDLDGVLDLFVAQHGFDAHPFPGAPDLLLSWKNGKLAEVAPSSFNPYPKDGFGHGAASADIDCDGDRDLFVVNANGNERNHLFVNDGTGKFAARDGQMPATLGSAKWQEAEFIDFDGDGDPDLFLGAAAHAEDPADLLLVNDGFGDFRTSAMVRPPAPRYSPTHAVNTAESADFTGDGLPDLVLFEIPKPFSTVSAIRFWENRGDGSFADVSEAWGLPAETQGEVVEPLRVVDFNNDGWPDFTVPPTIGMSSGESGMFINRGTRFEFVSLGTFESWLARDQPIPIDIDSDGDVDIVTDRFQTDDVLVRNLVVP